MKNQKTYKQVINKRAKKPKTSIIGFFFKLIFSLMILGAIAGSAAIFLTYKYYSQDLPKIATLGDYKPALVSEIYADDLTKIGEFAHERRILAPLSDMPDMLLKAFIAAEDARFYKHQGIDFMSIFRAFVKNITEGKIRQGGSTITQQVVKSFLLTPEKSYSRKIKEAILSYSINKGFTKNEILFLYLNQIYLGQGAYGVGAAADTYFGKKLKDLTLSECSILAGLPPAPSQYSPVKSMKLAKERQHYVLKQMVEENYITQRQADEAYAAEVKLSQKKEEIDESALQYIEHVRRYIETKYGTKTLYEGGLKVYTAVNMDAQKKAADAVDSGVRVIDKRQGFKGSEKPTEDQVQNLENSFMIKDTGAKGFSEGDIVAGIVTESAKSGLVVKTGNASVTINREGMAWAMRPGKDSSRKGYKSLPAVGDLVEAKLIERDSDTGSWTASLDQKPTVQGSLVCIENTTGYVKALIGGNDFKSSQFNRAIQAKRQPGSAFKPIVYAAALDKGYTPITTIVDAPISFKIGDKTWSPQNYNEKFMGPVTLRKALALSRNIISIKILQDIGVDTIISYAKNLGITSPLEKNLSLALGSSGVSLLELTNAYSVFANMGYKPEPIFVTKIVDKNGNILEENLPSREQVVDSASAYIMTSLLESVVNEGTATNIKALERPAAGKTGTSNEYYNAWFIGFTPEYSTGAWVGFDDEKTLGDGETGGKSASPIWLDFMKEALKDKPVEVFKAPESVVFAEVNTGSGKRMECFKEGTQPSASTELPVGEDSVTDEEVVTDTETLFKSDL